MHVVLVGPELEENLTLRYLKGALEAERHQVRIVEFASPREIDRAAGEIARSGAQVAGFSMVFTRRAREFARLVARCREMGFEGMTIAGGHFAAFHAERLLQDLPQLDAVAIGEGETMLCDIARGDRPLECIPGLVIRKGASILRTGPRAPVDDLDSLPWPDHRRPFDRYLDLPIVNMLGSRGCTHACGFCSIAAWHRLSGGRRYRQRSAAGIAAEMGCLAREGVRVFNFHDDNFLGNSRAENLARSLSLREELRKQKVGKIAFQIKARPDEIDPEVFALLRSMGLFRVFLGIEAGTETSLENLGRGQKLGDNVRALEILNGLDLHVAFNLLVLNPESTFEDFCGNVRFLREHLVNPMNFCRTEIYEGTPLERRLRREGRLMGNYWGLDYEIPDERAQLAFQLFRDAFFDRNFGAHPLHYLSGQVDYEHQLRMDFHGTTPDVRAAAKGFVYAVNENTVSYLEEVMEMVRGGRIPDGFRQDLFARVAADDARLHERGKEVLARIRDLRETQARTRAAHAGVALAAAMALSMAGCGPRRDVNHEIQHVEAPPPPPELLYDAQPYVTDAGTQEDLFPQVMEAAPYWEKPYYEAPVIGEPTAPDASTDPALVDAPPVKLKLEPPPSHVEAAPPPPNLEVPKNYK